MEREIRNFIQAAVEVTGLGVEYRNAQQTLTQLPPVCQRCSLESPELYSSCSSERMTIAEGERQRCQRGHHVVGYQAELVVVVPNTAAPHASQLRRNSHDQVSVFLDRLTELMPEIGRPERQSAPHGLQVVEGGPAAARREALVAPHAKQLPTTISPEEQPLLLATVRSLIGAIDAKDSYTRGHSERVHIGATILGDVLGVDPHTANALYWGSLLHDVGKIGSPDDVLKKPGKLTHAEYEIMKEHPARGDELLKPLEWLTEARQAVRHHHERIDGRGYPDGLAGDDIPFIARIVSVADTFDAVVSRRHYRDARDAERAIEVLREAAGTQLDARVVEAFEASFERIYAALGEAPVPAEGLREHVAMRQAA